MRGRLANRCTVTGSADGHVVVQRYGVRWIDAVRKRDCALLAGNVPLPLIFVAYRLGYRRPQGGQDALSCRVAGLLVEGAVRHPDPANACHVAERKDDAPDDILDGVEPVTRLFRIGFFPGKTVPDVYAWSVSLGYQI